MPKLKQNAGIQADIFSRILLSLVHLKKIAHICFVVLLTYCSVFAQAKFEFTVNTGPEQCYKGSADLVLTTPERYDSISVQFSAGTSTSKYSTTQLSAGDYHLHLFLRLADTTKKKLDTLVYFNIEKLQCPVFVPKYFSPNEDNYADYFEIGNISFYPEFELSVYNRQGTRVHHQENEFVPWDGRWLGAPLPDGTYYYILHYSKKNKTEVVQGDVTILR